MMSGNDTTTNVPIWIGSSLKLVSGINKSTTCQHVIQSLVQTENPKKFVLVEKWKQMERRLDGNVKILKVWKAWGNQKDDVALILKHHHSTDGYIDKKTSNKVPRRNKSHKLTNHDEKLQEKEVDRLLKLVLTQGETIQAQLRKLRQQEQQIEKFEEEMHKVRSLNEGDNYLIESYLRDDKGKKLRKRDKSPRKSSGWLKQQKHQHQHQNQNQSIGTTSSNSNNNNNSSNSTSTDTNTNRKEQGNPTVQTNPNFESEDPAEGDEENLQERSELLERICDLNSKLTKEEEHLVKLGLKIKKYYERHRRKRAGEYDEKGNGNEDDKNHVYEDENSNSNGTGNGKNCGQGDEENFQVAILEDSQEYHQLVSQLESLRDVTNEQSCEIELNEKGLNDLEELLDLKHDHVAQLTYQIQLLDQESENLRNRLFKVSQNQNQNNQSCSSSSSSCGLSVPVPVSGQVPVPVSVPLYPSASLSSYPCTTPKSSLSLSLPPPSHHLQPSLPLQQVSFPYNHSNPQEHQHQHHQQQQKIPPHSNSHQPVSACASVDSSSTSTSASGPFQTSEMMFPTSTQLNLHMKPCRDNQDNDSNSDTGISSLHSSGDEHNLLVLDTLV